MVKQTLFALSKHAESSVIIPHRPGNFILFQVLPDHIIPVYTVFRIAVDIIHAKFPAKNGNITVLPESYRNIDQFLHPGHRTILLIIIIYILDPGPIVFRMQWWHCSSLVWKWNISQFVHGRGIPGGTLMGKQKRIVKMKSVDQIVVFILRDKFQIVVTVPPGTAHNDGMFRV